MTDWLLIIFMAFNAWMCHYNFMQRRYALMTLNFISMVLVLIAYGERP